MATNTTKSAAVMSHPSPKTIFLWFRPRSLSTAVEKCVASMNKVEVWHEPYIASYINEIFGSEESMKTLPSMSVWQKQTERTIIRMMETGHTYNSGNLSPVDQFTFEWVKDKLEKPLPEGVDFRFVKEAALSMDGKYDKLPNVPTKHTFIIRHPRRIAWSLRRLLIHGFEHQGDPDDFDVSSGHPLGPWGNRSTDPMLALWNHVRENIDPNPVVIDADDLQSNPEKILKKYCEAVGIPFKESYLKWDGSDEIVRSYHGPMEQIMYGREEQCYDKAFLSSCFLPLQSEVLETVPEKCKVYVERIMKGYKMMYETRIEPE